MLRLLALACALSLVACSSAPSDAQPASDTAIMAALERIQNSLDDLDYRLSKIEEPQPTPRFSRIDDVADNLVTLRGEVGALQKAVDELRGAIQQICDTVVTYCLLRPR